MGQSMPWHHWGGMDVKSWPSVAALLAVSRLFKQVGLNDDDTRAFYEPACSTTCATGSQLKLAHLSSGTILWLEPWPGRIGIAPWERSLPQLRRLRTSLLPSDPQRALGSFQGVRASPELCQKCRSDGVWF
jgi:hypothetical protein